MSDTATVVTPAVPATPAAPAATAQSNADAVLVPETYARGPYLIDRIKAILNVAEPLLGVDRSKNEKAYFRPIEVRNTAGAKYYLVTRGNMDTYFHPIGHPTKPQQHRYKWVDRGDLRIGTFVDPTETSKHEVFPGQET